MIPTISPFDPSMVVPPLPQELTKRGLAPASDDKSVKLSTHVLPAVAYAIDRLVEQRIFGFKTRQEFQRWALQSKVNELVEEVQNGEVQTMLRRYNEQVRAFAEVELLGNINDMVTMTKKLVRAHLAVGNRLAAIRALQGAKRYMEEIPYDGTRRRFKLSLYGGDGSAMPEHWEESLAARLWDKVLEGELDLDDEEVVKERMRVY